MATQAGQIPKEVFINRLESALEWGAKCANGGAEGNRDFWKRLAQWEKLAEEEKGIDD
jgi:hypothetical protein